MELAPTDTPMNTCLLYFLIVFASTDWHSATVLKEFREADRCEAIERQLEKIEGGSRHYRCMTMVTMEDKA